MEAPSDDKNRHARFHHARAEHQRHASVLDRHVFFCPACFAVFPGTLVLPWDHEGLFPPNDPPTAATIGVAMFRQHASYWQCFPTQELPDIVVLLLPFVLCALQHYQVHTWYSLCNYSRPCVLWAKRTFLLEAGLRVRVIERSSRE